MVKEKVTYVDFNGAEHTEELYFNLNKMELMELQATTAGGYAEKLKKAAKEEDISTMFLVFKDLVLRGYGKKSEDGLRFVKSPEETKKFEESMAFSEFMFAVMNDEEKMKAFVNGLVPNVK